MSQSGVTCLPMDCFYCELSTVKIHFWVLVYHKVVIINISSKCTTGLYNATKTLAFASYFCKMQVKILY
jgi:hypothetical protein